VHHLLADLDIVVTHADATLGMLLAEAVAAVAGLGVARALVARVVGAVAAAARPLPEVAAVLLALVVRAPVAVLGRPALAAVPVAAHVPLAVQRRRRRLRQQAAAAATHDRARLVAPGPVAVVHAAEAHQAARPVVAAAAAAATLAPVAGSVAALAPAPPVRLAVLVGVRAAAVHACHHEGRAVLARARVLGAVGGRRGPRLVAPAVGADVLGAERGGAALARLGAVVDGAAVLRDDEGILSVLACFRLSWLWCVCVLGGELLVSREKGASLTFVDTKAELFRVMILYRKVTLNTIPMAMTSYI